MDRKALVRRVKTNLRDQQLTAFTEVDIIDFINEGIDRVMEVIPQFDIQYLEYDTAIPNPIPRQYQHLLAIYSTARCFAQDERAYQSTTFMNEFEIKLSQMNDDLLSGDLIALDKDGNEIDFDATFFVKNEYYANKYGFHKFKE